MTEERFWAKVNKEGADGCWEWLGGKWSNGYGRFCCNGKNVRAHRYSWTLKNGAIPDDLIIRHKCRGKCVNPDHLELGTNQDNADDMIRDGTRKNGNFINTTKLTPEQVLDIRSRINITRRELAKEFNVVKSTIDFIIHKKTWRHLD